MYVHFIYETFFKCLFTLKEEMFMKKIYCVIKIVLLVCFSMSSVFALDYMREDFDGEAESTVPLGWVNESGSWQVTALNENLVYKQIGTSNSGAHSSYNLPTDLSNLVVDFAFNINDSISNAAVWMSLRWIDNNNYIQFGHYQGAWTIRQRKNGTFTTLATFSEPISGWQYVRAIAQDDVVALYVDQKIKLLATGVTHTTAGDMAIYSHYAETDFDNIHAYELLQADYFDDETVSTSPSGWTVESGKWEVLNDIGTNNVYWKNSQESGAHTVYAAIDKANLTIEGKFQVSNKANKHAIWYAARWLDNNNYIQFGYNNGDWTIRERVNGSWTVLDTKPETLADGWHSIKITAFDKYLVLRVDGETKVTARTATHLISGKVALYAHNADVYFDDLTVYQADEMNFKSRIQAPSVSQKNVDDIYKTWGFSVKKDDNGTFHYFGNRWTRGYHWYYDNKIIYGTSSTLEGPYIINAGEENIPNEISGVSKVYDPAELEDGILRMQSWSANEGANPYITKFGDTYYLYYVGTFHDQNNPNSGNTLDNQRIGLVTAPSLYGPWTVHPNNPILEPRENNWDTTRVVNPVVYRSLDGTFHLLYKAVYSGGGLKMGIATSSNPDGPWTRENAPNFPITAEDPTVFKEKGKYYMLAKVFSSEIIPNHDGIMYESFDGKNWEISPYFYAYNGNINWSDDVPDQGDVNYCKMERVFVYVEGGVAKGIGHAIQKTCNYSDSTLSFSLMRKLN